MKLRLLSGTMVLAILTISSPAWAETVNTEQSGLWSNDSTWDTVLPPADLDNVIIGSHDVTLDSISVINGGIINNLQAGATINTTGSVTVVAGGIYNGSGQIQFGRVSGGMGTLTVNGGTITNANSIHLGKADNAHGVLNIIAGSVRLNGDKHLIMGNAAGGTGKATISGGTFSSGGKIDLGAKSDGSGTLTVSGDGKVNVGTALNVGLNGTGLLTINGADAEVYANSLTVGNGTTGTVHLIEGLLQIESGTDGILVTDGIIALEKGVLKWKTSDVQDLIDLYEVDERLTGTNGFAFGGGIALASTNSVVDMGNGYNMVFGLDGSDYATAYVEAIPEPATLGLIMAFGGGLFFIRRRRMIK